MSELRSPAHHFGVEKRTPPPARTMPAEAVRYALQQLDAALEHLDHAHPARMGVVCARAELLFHAIGSLEITPQQEAAE
ncbi:MAG TPA: hypothetical protein VGH29_07195 [Candidatus Binataceae bacterium]|jgi:hypothetical protein